MPDLVSCRGRAVTRASPGVITATPSGGKREQQNEHRGSEEEERKLPPKVPPGRDPLVVLPRNVDPPRLKPIHKMEDSHHKARCPHSHLLGIDETRSVVRLTRTPVKLHRDLEPRGPTNRHKQRDREVRHPSLFTFAVGGGAVISRQTEAPREWLTRTGRSRIATLRIHHRQRANPTIAVTSQSTYAAGPQAQGDGSSSPTLGATSRSRWNTRLRAVCKSSEAPGYPVRATPGP
jgi:hypothetical protein